MFFYKHKGSVQECTSYRAVLLLATFAKACHKSLRAPLKSLFEQSAPSFQIGGMLCNIWCSCHTWGATMGCCQRHHHFWFLLMLRPPSMGL